ncbi:hypothetical protein Nepgr_000665 [Nepenthes gracilis]|uniref:Ubiquitin-like protease family profile domain-containing protein n=1 Tax=Nepenthes gracilis TaxID=150966 RepID=A0AAD3P3B6_NEPGR|nr:hypothetical protein Nepgr_000665 [Nepenthes gracilis]
MGTLAADEKILSYNDVVLRQSDLDILSGPFFLNDRIIEFYFSYLMSSYPSDDILLVSPVVAFWIGNCPDEEALRVFMEPLNLGAKKLVIFPINDNNDVTRAEGGSHWSLLAFERNANIFVHHDSFRGANSWHAERLYASVVGFMGCSESHGRYVEYADTPQQVNGYDCGVFVIAIARAICCWYVSSGGSNGDDEDGLWFSAMKEQVTLSAVAEMRSVILRLIRSLMAV